MKRVFLVGGAVRDDLLGRVAKDRDFLVLGVTPQQLQKQGFIAVGNSFEIFLHPSSKEQYALPRSTTHNHVDLETQLEVDLGLRDLTLNAIAQEVSTGKIFDPFGGVRDIENRILRSLPNAFQNDPLRILRVARFAAELPEFNVHSDTLQEMQTVARRFCEDIKNLPGERIFAELLKALQAPAPARFFEILREASALEIFFPEIDCLFGVPQPEIHHPEIDTGVHVLLCLNIAAQLTNDPVARFGALVHDLGKGATPRSKWPSHHGHEEAGIPLVKALCERLRAPAEFCVLGELVSRYHLIAHQTFEVRAGTLGKMFHNMGLYRQGGEEKLERFLVACEADARGRKGFEHKKYPQAAALREAFAATKEVSGEMLLQEGHTPGPELGAKLHEKRVLLIKSVCSNIKYSKERSRC